MDNRALVDQFEWLLRSLFSELGEFEVMRDAALVASPDAVDFAVRSPDHTYRFELKTRQRITPQIADDLFLRAQTDARAAGTIVVMFAPTISARVAEIARRHGVSYMDGAGNCWLRSAEAGLLISRAGRRDQLAGRSESRTDPFAPKSSRIVRAMLHEPQRGWYVNELAEHADVDVSAGLASRVKQTLVRENFAVVHQGLLYLKNPRELLEAWSRSYTKPKDERPFYLRGEVASIEEQVAAWCKSQKIEYALARFSAAWRHVPEVRYSVASVYVGSKALGAKQLESLRDACGAKPVDSGANLVLLSPYDRSVFVRCEALPEQTTSPLQTYLDLRTMAARGEEAANAVLNRRLLESLETPSGLEDA